MSGRVVVSVNADVDVVKRTMTVTGLKSPSGMVIGVPVRLPFWMVKQFANVVLGVEIEQELRKTGGGSVALGANAPEGSTAPGGTVVGSIQPEK